MSLTDRAPRPHPRWIKPFARAGYAARGIVYLVIGFYALTAAVSGGQTEDTRGALEILTDSGPGTVLVVMLIAGLAGYSAWRFVQSLLDTDDHGMSPKGLAVRGGLLASAITYAVLTLYTVSLWRGAGGEEGGGDVAQWLSGFVGARITAFVLAATFAGVAIAHFVKAWKRGYARHIEAPQRAMKLVDPVARAGLSARGAVFAVLALLLLTRGLTASGEGAETPGLGDALDWITSLPAGSLLLGLMGVGLLAFALYSLTEAVWRRINVEDASLPGR